MYSILNTSIMEWTNEQIMAMAPDTATANRGKSLSSPTKWLEFYKGENVLWGKCKGSGKNPYLAAIDLNGPAFKCSCPSRKFPCKHGLGLMMIYVENASSFSPSEQIPESISTWLNKRKQKNTPENKSSAPSPEKEAAKANRFEKRKKLMASGIDDLQNWILDMIRTGLASISADHQLWESMAMRMVDAKMSGIARRIREIALLFRQNPDAYEEVLFALSDLYLITKSFYKIDDLNENLQRDIYAYLGVNTPSSEVLQSIPIQDEYWVLSIEESKNIDNALMRKTWLRGIHKNRFALIVEYDYTNAGFSFHWQLGRIYQADMYFFPRTIPLRAIAGQTTLTTKKIEDIKGINNFIDFKNKYQNYLAQQPWLSNIPELFLQVSPIKIEKRFYLLDQYQQTIALENDELKNWKAIAVSGGHPLDIFGEWDGRHFKIKTIIHNNRLINL